MQKLDFVQNLQLIVNRLKSYEITDVFEESFKNPGKAYDFRKLLQLLFESKSNFDAIIKIPQVREIIGSLNTYELFDSVTLSQLARLFDMVAPSTVLISDLVIRLYAFHSSLTRTIALARRVLLNDVSTVTFDENLEDGRLIFQIVIEGEGLETESYIKIITALQELFNTIAEVEGEANQKPEIILLDSGSDTNLGIKAGVETAKSVFLVFKEIWDYVVNFRHYKQERKIKSLMDSLTIREEIKKKVEAGVITPNEGKAYAHMIKTRTDDLIGMKVMPKQIVIESNEVSNKQLLEDFEGYKLLGNGE